MRLKIPKTPHDGRRTISIALLMLFGCQDLAGTAPLPAGVQGPSAFQTAAGAVQQANAAMTLFVPNVQLFIARGGLFTDEIIHATGLLGGEAYTDARRASEDPRSSHVSMLQAAHKVRGQARLARGALVAYAPESSKTLQALMYVVEGYTEILMADHFCSGIPLSTVNFPIGHTLKAGSTTAEVYTHAAELLDSAIVLASGNDSITWLARVGLGRALLALQRYDSAAAAVAAVPDSFVYRIYEEHADASARRFFPMVDVFGTMGDREGGNGMPYVTGGDPRTRGASMVITKSRAAGNGIATQYTGIVPGIYLDALQGARFTLVLASGVEARLITAEADLANGRSTWLTVLNRLRTNGVTTVTLRTDQPGVSPGPAGYPDTTWGPGSGIRLLAPSVLADVKPVCPTMGQCTDTVWYRGLAPLVEPSAGAVSRTAEQVNLLFRERASWLYLRGNRVGDLRRMIRQYGRIADDVFPTGVNDGPLQTYGTDVVFRVIDQGNPLYKGCVHYGA